MGTDKDFKIRIVPRKDGDAIAIHVGGDDIEIPTYQIFGSTGTLIPNEYVDYYWHNGQFTTDYLWIRWVPSEPDGGFEVEGRLSKVIYDDRDLLTSRVHLFQYHVGDIPGIEPYINPDYRGLYSEKKGGRYWQPSKPPGYQPNGPGVDPKDFEPPPNGSGIRKG